MNWVALYRRIPSTWGRIEIRGKTLEHGVLRSLMHPSRVFSAAPRPPANSSRIWSPSRRKTRHRHPPPLPSPDPSHLQSILAQLPPRFTSEDLSHLLHLQRDPILCLHIFNWASRHPRFKPDSSTFLITIKKLGAARLYHEMDSISIQALSITSIASEDLFNTIIYFYAEARMLSKAVNVYKRMRDSPSAAACRPSISTYNLLFGALLSKEKNSYINYLYMDTIRSLFRQMIDAGIEPDIFILNSIIRGYVLSLHINDALRIFHQMGIVYRCLPNEHSYNYIVHGLCAQGRTENAKDLYLEMKNKGFSPSGRVYNSLVCAQSMAGEIDDAVRIIWEMSSMRRRIDAITLRTVLEEMCLRGRVEDAMKLLREFKEKDLVDGWSFRDLMHEIHDNYGDESGDVSQKRRFRVDR